MSVVQLQAGYHAVRETKASRFFRRRLNFNEVMTYFNHITRQWVLGYWLNRRSRCIFEIDDLGSNFEELTPGFVEMVVSCWGPVDMSKHKARIADQGRRKIRETNDRIYEDQERWDWLKEKTKDKAPMPYAFQA